MMSNCDCVVTPRSPLTSLGRLFPLSFAFMELILCVGHAVHLPHTLTANVPLMCSQTATKCEMKIAN